MNPKTDGGMEAEWKHRLGECRKVTGALKNIWRKRKVTTGAKLCMYNGIIVPSMIVKQGR